MNKFGTVMSQSHQPSAPWALAFVTLLSIAGPGTTTVSTGGTSTAGVLCDYTHSAVNAHALVNLMSTATWSCTSSLRKLSANGVPDHDVGPFNIQADLDFKIAAQSINVSAPIAPVLATTATPLGGPAGDIGYILNGVKIDPGTGGNCNDNGSNCTLLGQAMTLVGWAADGFPIYARYGHSVATDASSSIKVVKSSYRVKTTSDANRPATSLYPMGTFLQDHEYVSGLGDLDECNGRTGVTPEFPGGIYHYYATDTYPYLQRCIKGQR